MLPLSYRRDLNDIVFFHRCMYIYNTSNHIKLNNYVNFTRKNVRHTRSSTDISKLCTPYCRTQSLQMSYFNRVVNLWNSVPEQLRAINDSNNFKYNLYNYFKLLFYTKYNPDIYNTWHINA